jgi:hypothetical protein
MPTSIDGASSSNRSLIENFAAFATQSQQRVLDIFESELSKEIQASQPQTPKPITKDVVDNSSLIGLMDDGLQYLGITKNAQGQREGLLGNVATWFEGTSAGKWLLGAAPVSGAKAASAAGASGAAAGSSALSTGEAITSAAFGVYDMVKNFGKMSLEHGVTTGIVTGASIGSMFGGPLVGGLIGAAVGGLISLFKNSGKPKEQKERDQMRKALQQAGIIDDKFSIGLADGSRYDIGIDGKAKAEFGGRKPFEIDQQNPLAVSVFRVFAELAMQVTGGNQALAQSLAGYLTNASLSNAGGNPKLVKENMQAIIAQFKGASRPNGDSI